MTDSDWLDAIEADHGQDRSGVLSVTWEAVWVCVIALAIIIAILSVARRRW